MVLTEYELHTDKVGRDYTFVMLSDLHARPFDEALGFLNNIKPDAVLIVGDLVDRHKKNSSTALPFVSQCAKVAPTFFVYGNHEIKYPALTQPDFENAGARVLDNTYSTFGDSDEFVIGGQRPYGETEWLSNFEAAGGNNSFHILLDHHPEHYKRYLKEKHADKLDLIVSAHAHGGQIRVFNHGILSPDQGVFPKYTKGLYDNKLIVGTGLSNTGGIVPRWGNPTEVLRIKISQAK